MKVELARLAREALITSDFKALGDALSTQQLPDSFGVLADPELVAAIASQLHEGGPAEWLTRSITWNAELYSPTVELTTADQLLHLLWQDLNTRLALKLDAVVRRNSVAPRGAVLCFFGRAQFSAVVEYTRSVGGAVGLRPLAASLEPNGVLELPTLFDGKKPEVRNAIKNAALSVDKLVFQRGSIVHVDRQREDVFGPTIDTVILGELLAEWLDSQNSDRKIAALEIGPGSGLLSAILGASDRVRELVAVDLNGAAVACTIKNLLINDITLDSKFQRVRVRAERFDSDQFPSPFDFIVCNPPYIPEAPASTATSMKEYGRAVGGLDLCLDILKSLPKLLSPDGVLLLMASSLSEHTVAASIPDGFEAIAALEGNGRRVPLDVDVVWRRHDWRERLLADGHIEQDEDGGLWHQLRPLWIKRRREAV